MDNLLALRVFVRIVDAGGFAKAADAMNLPRATATKLIQDLEKHLRVKLLHRTTRQVSVTPEGAAYYERAARLIAELEEMDEAVSNARAQLRGRIRVDVGSVLANQILIPALPDLRARYPELHVDLGVSDRPVNLIGEGVDCVIRGGDLPDTSMVARHLADLDWVTVASPVYLKARGEPTHPDDLQTQPARPDDTARLPGHAIAGYFSSLTGRAFALEFHKDGERRLVQADPAVAVNESTAHLSTLLAGVGIGQTFRFAAQPWLDNGQLRQVLPDWTRPHHPLHLLYPLNRHRSAKLLAFADWAQGVFAPFDRRKG
ncbi:DNA-binding transcriptional LysR family regulator [Silvimonas terrae]|uniref:DNA-binding transcriptional LysR family regulator n=1 Tax=Silvimonas terrae TaxID=300266 RepID=A0A840RFP3_9NEIS|nr:LysR family transcriptional regulator [Silvimonas terrae]MBB5191186.1 DNA-binding transcriptional LysR family regulator [Silvimonas terrae]